MSNRTRSMAPKPSPAEQAHEDATQSKKETSIDEMKPRTLDQMLRYRAKLTPDMPLLWYPSTGTEYVSHSAQELNSYVEQTARKYAHYMPRRTNSEKKPTVVALLGLANLSYVVTMFALYRLGHTIVALSPRLAREGYEHLLKELSVQAVIYHQSQKKMANILKDNQKDLRIHSLIDEGEYTKTKNEDEDEATADSEFDMEIESNNLAVVIHSSGSTGLPKPTKLSHDTLIMAASKNMNMKAFSCVPFFHGFGLNGLHRAIFSGRPFLFYNASIPLTSDSLIATIKTHDCEIFFCVPYALKLLAETEDGISALKKCKLVWFAGSACPDDLGDSLTEKGIRLISDYGLSECGPLMTTMRPEDDHAWNYLRPLPHNKPYMEFEERSEGAFELVCHDGMPWKTAANRDDGSYATGDLFEKHPHIEDAYRFTSRQDDTLVLSNGEKANPSGPEGGVRQHPLVAEAVMFGTGKTELGMVLVRSEAAKDMEPTEIVHKVWPLIKESQKEMPEHAKIVKSMVVTLASGTDYPRTDKGTIIRQQFYRKFADEIEDAYIEKIDDHQLQLDDAELQSFIHDEVVNALGLEDKDEVGPDTDLFSLGVDSLQSTQLRRTLQTRLDLKGNKLPFNVVYENPTIKQLSAFVSSLISGNSNLGTDTEEVFSNLIEQHGNFTMPATIKNDGACIVLTGATGSLGAHLLAQLLKDEEVTKVFCLVRAPSSTAAFTRVNESLQKRKLLQDLDDSEKSKFEAMVADLAAPNLGLDMDTYRQISIEVTTVIHAAWPVNFNMKLQSFEGDIAGTKNLLDLCLSRPQMPQPSFAFCSSISTSMNRPQEEPVPETVPTEPTPALEMGYAQSKLVAENLCRKAAEQTGLKAYIVRIGQIVGDTVHGVWNANEAVPMMIQCAETIGVLPNIEELHRWLPADTMAKIVLETTLTAKAPAGSVFNVINPVGFRWKSDLLPKLRHAGVGFKEVSVTEWLDRLRNSEHDGSVNPPIKLLSYFETVYGADDGHGRGEDREWETDNASAYSPTFAQGWTLSDEVVDTFVNYFRDECWNQPSRDRARKGSWSSDKTLGDEEELNEVVDKDDGKESIREQMDADLGRNERADSVVTLKGDDDDSANATLFWNDEKKMIETQYLNPWKNGQVGTPPGTKRVASASIDLESLNLPKTVVWSNGRFDLSDSAEVASSTGFESRTEDETSSESTLAPDDDEVVLLRAGEVFWDVETGRFDVAKYDEDLKDTNTPVYAMTAPTVDMETVRLPKSVYWTGSGWICE